MSTSVIIPVAKSDQPYINRTIENIYNSTEDPIEVIVVLNGHNQMIDQRAKVIPLPSNVGERVAMNMAARMAHNEFLLRIDAHCDFSPHNWDRVLEAATGPRDMTQAVLTAVTKDWVRKPEHRYERCRLLPTMEAKWEKPNEDASSGQTIPNMSSTGCGFMIPREFYWQIGGADETLPIMGAIGEEFSVKTWLHGGKVQTCLPVIIGHIFGTGGYDTNGVIVAREMLEKKYGGRYHEIKDKFPDIEIEGPEVTKLRPTAKHKRDDVIVRRTDTSTTRNTNGETIRQVNTFYEYLWIPDEHPAEVNWTQDQIEKKYSIIAHKIGEQMLIRDMDGKMIDAKTGEISYEITYTREVDQD